MKPTWAQPSQGQLPLTAAVNAALDGASVVFDPDRMGATGEVAPLATYAGLLSTAQLDMSNLKRCDKKPIEIQLYP